MSEEKIVKKAYAKINLGLDVVGRLDNGYHLVKMIMQTVNIYDVLTFEKLPQGIVITTDNGELPVNEDNLIYKAAKALMDKYKVTGGVKIHLEKHIPIAAGMAGGSSDAATTLKGVNQLFALGADLEELKELAVKIGADVPYCLCGGTMLSEGIGEILTPLKRVPEAVLLIAKPDINVSTKYVYETLDSKPIENHPDIDGMVVAIENSDLQGIIDRLGNVLELVTIGAHPVISTIKDRMEELGASKALMSGSGPTVFGVFTNEETAENAYRQLCEDNLAKQVFLTSFYESEAINAG